MAALALVLPMGAAGCSHPLSPQIEWFMAHDAGYANLPSGPQRVDALWREAIALAGSNRGALDLLGTLAAYEGFQRKHPFNTGLTAEGMLARTDKTDHFFAHAMWYYYDRQRPFGVAEFYSIGWEVLGELRSWFNLGSPFNWRDIWANHLGWEFGRRLHNNRHNPDYQIMPSDVISQAERFRPERVPPDSNAVN